MVGKETPHQVMTVSKAPLVDSIGSQEEASVLDSSTRYHEAGGHYPEGASPESPDPESDNLGPCGVTLDLQQIAIEKDGDIVRRTKILPIEQSQVEGIAEPVDPGIEQGTRGRKGRFGPEVDRAELTEFLGTPIVWKQVLQVERPAAMDDAFPPLEIDRIERSALPAPSRGAPPETPESGDRRPNVGSARVSTPVIRLIASPGLERSRFDENNLPSRPYEFARDGQPCWPRADHCEIGFECITRMAHRVDE